MNTTPFSSFQTCVSVQCSHSVVSDSFWPHGLHRPPCPSPTLGACSDSCPSCWWCHPTTSCPVAPSPPAFNLSQHQSFLRSQFFASGGQNIRVSASASVLPMNIQDWFRLGLTGLISLLLKRFSRVFSNTTVQKCSAFFKVQLLHPYMTTGKTIALTRYLYLCWQSNVSPF